MKRYSLIVALHIIGIAFLSVGVYLLVDAGLWFSALMAFLILLAIAVHLYRLQMMQVRMMRHLAESLRYDDMMLSFRSPYKNRSMEDMVDELSEAMRNFRTRVLERNEMEAWQKLIRVLTHEIMNSITPIISLSETLSEREMSEKNYPVMRQGMQTIHRRSKGLLEFVENYRKLTRLPAPVRRPVAVRELLQDLQKLFSEEYIRIELPETDRILQIDRTQIEQVLINLIKNAKEACSRKEHPRIEVKMLPALSWQCLITVSDNGEGILPEVQDKIFVPFFTTKPSGSGIGLSLCKQVMNRHGGNITVQSTVGKGSCFTGTQVGDVYTVPISHGEGRFLCSEELVRRLADNGQIITQYVDVNGVPGMDVDVNPNGSIWAIEGITSPDGRVLGKMGHAERIGDGLYQNVDGCYDMKLFQSAKKYFDI